MIWLVPITLVVLAERTLADASPVARMFGICTALFFGMKPVVLAGVRMPWRNRLAFLLWPGMRPRAFLKRRERGGGPRLVAEGLARFALGVALVVVARRTDSVIALMVGFSLTVHFGLFRMLAGAWRMAGFDTKPLFRDPARSHSLAQFWTQRWNRAFSEMIQVAVHRPLARVAGPAVATWAGFFFSGLLHELAITVPARGGYGLPTLYFLLQALLVRRVRGRLATMACVLVPVALVFPPPFIDGVVRALL